MKRILILLVLFVSLFSSSQAQTTIAVSGTITADPTNTFSVSDAITITYTISSAANAGAELFSQDFGQENEWEIGNVSSDGVPIFSDVSGTAFTGTFANPQGEGIDPQEQLRVGHDSKLTLRTYEYFGGSLGLSLGGNAITEINTINFVDHTWTFPNAGYLHPDSYFSGHTGSFAATAYDYELAIIKTSLGNTTFDITNIAIGGAVPEPGSFALFLGLGMLGFVSTRRQRR